MFGKTVLGIDGERVRRRAGRGQGRRRASTSDVDLDVDDLQDAGRRRSRRSSREQTGRDFPQDPREQLDLAIRAVFDSWNTDRARLYRRQERIPRRPRHRGERLRDGLRQPRRRLRHRRRVHPRPGDRAARASYGDYLPNAQGEDVVAGIRNTAAAGRPRSSSTRRRYDELLRRSCAGWRRTTATCATSSSPSSAASCGCCRPGSASAPRRAAFRIATQLVDEQLITLDEALQRVTGAPAGAADVPAVRPVGASATLLDPGHGGVPGCGRRQGGVRLGDRGRAGPARGEHVDPGAPGDQPGRPATA